MYNDRNITYLRDIVESSEAIFEYIKGMSFEKFKKDRKTYMAVIKEFEIIGEATAKLSKEIKNKYKEIPWRNIKDFRNILVHEYFGIDLEIVWKVILNDLKPLKEIAMNILDQIDEKNG